MNNLVSIVVPVYNSQLYLDRCIQSLVNQTYKNIEIILVNDGSTDGSGEICDRYALEESRIKVIHKSNGGLVSSRKTGVTIANGSYVLYIDGDDWVEVDIVEEYMKQVFDYNVDIVVSSHNVNLEGRIEVLSNTLPVGYYDKKDLIKHVYPKMMYTGKFSQFGIFSYSWGKLYKKDLLLKNQLKVREDITMGEDALCFYPTLLDANSLSIINTPSYHYRQRADSLIKTLRTVEISKMENIYKDFLEIFSSKNVLDIMLPQLQHYLLSLLTVNTEGPEVTNSKLKLYPFDGIENKDNIVIYGGGTFGQHLFKKIGKYSICNIVGWIDERHVHYSLLGLPVTGLDILQNLNYDKIVIALIDEDNSNKAKLQLLDYGIEQNKIIQVSYYKDMNIQKLLLQYKINLN